MMHFQNPYGDVPFISGSSGSVMVDNSMSWPLLTTTVAGPPLVTSAPPAHSLYAPDTCTSALSRPSLYQFPAAAGQESNLMSGAPTGVPYYPDEASSAEQSPVPSSPSTFCESVTDSPAPSSSSSQAVDVSLRNFVEQRNAMVAKFPNMAARAEVEPSLEEQLSKIKPLLRKPIDTTGMNDRQVQRLAKRRERNKVAAEKCRVKRREKSGQIKQELAVLSRSNEELEQELIRLRSEMRSLQQMLCSHHCSIGHSKEELAQIAGVTGSES